MQEKYMYRKNKYRKNVYSKEIPTERNMCRKGNMP